MRIGALHVYPVKSMRGCSLDVAIVERQGLRDDRRWMVVDEGGSALTARTVRAMLCVTARADEDGALVLTAGRRAPLHVPVPYGGAVVRVSLSRVGTTRDGGPDAARFSSPPRRPCAGSTAG